MQRWVRLRAAADLSDWHWLAATERDDGLLLAACDRAFAESDVDLIRAYSDDVPRERRCPACQAVYGHLIFARTTSGRLTAGTS